MVSEPSAKLSEAPLKANASAELKVQRIYTKSSLFEAANVAYTESAAIQPVIDLQVHANVYPQPGENMHEVVLTLQVTAKHNGALWWRVQLQQAGRYALIGFTPETEQLVLNGFCMNQLYPYACAEVSHLVNQGGFGMVHLQPIDFAQRYKEQQSISSATAASVDTIPTSVN